MWKLDDRLFSAVGTYYRPERRLNDDGLLLLRRRNYQTRGFLRDSRFGDLLDRIADVCGLGNRFALRTLHDENSMTLDKNVIKRLSIEHLSKRIAYRQPREVNAEFPVCNLRGDNDCHRCRWAQKRDQAVQGK